MQPSPFDSSVTEADLHFDRAHIWHPYTSVTQGMPIFPVVSAQGVRLRLEDGRELIDGMSSWWSAIHGYNHPQLNAAAHQQIDNFSHVMFGGLTHKPAIELCRRLVAMTPEPLQTVFLADSGSVSVEVAIKMAVQYWRCQGDTRRKKLLTIRNGYHGDTTGAMAVCDPDNGMHTLFRGVLLEHIFVDAPTCLNFWDTHTLSTPNIQDTHTLDTGQPSEITDKKFGTSTEIFRTPINSNHPFEGSQNMDVLNLCNSSSECGCPQLKDSPDSKTMGVLDLSPNYGCPESAMDVPNLQTMDVPNLIEDIHKFEQALAEHHKDLVGVILEPIVQGAGGMRFYSPLYLRRVSELCKEYGVLLILDEIATGFGRTGKLFACEHAGIVPDIMTVGKALTGGYMTLAAVICSDEVSRTISDHSVLMHGPTFMGNPLACRVACASLDIIATGQWQQQVAQIERGLLKGLAPCKEMRAVAHVRVLGAIGVVELKQPVDMRTLQPRLVQEGIWVRPFGKLIYVMPPYIISLDDLATLCRGIVRVVAELSE